MENKKKDNKEANNNTHVIGTRIAWTRYHLHKPLACGDGAESVYKAQRSNKIKTNRRGKEEQIVGLTIHVRYWSQEEEEELSGWWILGGGGGGAAEGQSVCQSV